MKQYDITHETPPGTYIKAVVGERFSIRMPEVSGRIIEPALGQHSVADHTCRSEGGGFVSFDMISLKAGSELIEFPLIEQSWDGASDPNPAKAEPYASVLVVVLERAGLSRIGWTAQCSHAMGRGADIVATLVGQLREN
jgi:hypothetical protein